MGGWSSMTDLKQRIHVIGWLAQEDQKMLSETDRLSFFYVLL
jgi:hypothetical protein